MTVVLNRLLIRNIASAIGALRAIISGQLKDSLAVDICCNRFTVMRASRKQYKRPVSPIDTENLTFINYSRVMKRKQKHSVLGNYPIRLSSYFPYFLRGRLEPTRTFSCFRVRHVQPETFPGSFPTLCRATPRAIVFHSQGVQSSP